MSVMAPRVSRGARIGELALWTSAAVLMLSAHVAAAMYMMQQEPIEAGDNAPPPAIMIELAPEPEAVNTQEDQVAPDVQESQEVKSETVQPVEEPQPEPVPEPIPEPVEPPPEIAEPVEPEPVEPEPVEQVQEETPEPTPEITESVPEPPPEPVEEIDPIEQQMIAALENVEVPLPMSRPPPPVEKPPEEKKAETKKPTAKRPPPKPQQQAQAERSEAKLQTRESNRTAASQNSASSASSSVSPARWASRVMSHLQRRKRYPKEAEREGQQGTVYIRFSIDTGGNVLSVSVLRSSGFPLLDNAVVDLVKRASPVPAPPAGVDRNVTVPMTFKTR